jgi:hypothetical protein
MRLVTSTRSSGRWSTSWSWESTQAATAASGSAPRGAYKRPGAYKRLGPQGATGPAGRPALSRRGRVVGWRALPHGGCSNPERRIHGSHLPLSLGAGTASLGGWYGRGDGHPSRDPSTVEDCALPSRPTVLVRSPTLEESRAAFQTLAVLYVLSNSLPSWQVGYPLDLKDLEIQGAPRQGAWIAFPRRSSSLHGRPFQRRK